MARAADDIILNEQSQRLFDQMLVIINSQSDGLALMNVTQDLAAELLRRNDDLGLREQTLAEVSRFFLAIIKAPDLSENYKMNRLRAFARATVKILLDGRVGNSVTPPPPGLARRATDGGAVKR